MPRYRRPRRQGVVYGPVTQREAGSDGGFIGRLLGMLIVLGAVTVLGVGAFNFIAGPANGPAAPGSPSPTQVGLASPSAGPTPTIAPVTPRPTPSQPASPTPEPSPDATPFQLTIGEGPGSIVFGIGRGANLTIRQLDTSFEPGQRIFYLAELTETAVTEALDIEVSHYDVASGEEELVSELDVNARIPRIHTLRQRLDTSSLDGPGVYVMRFVAGAQVLAEGWFELVEPD